MILSIGERRVLSFSRVYFHGRKQNYTRENKYSFRQPSHVKNTAHIVILLRYGVKKNVDMSLKSSGIFFEYLFNIDYFLKTFENPLWIFLYISLKCKILLCYICSIQTIYMSRFILERPEK